MKRFSLLTIVCIAGIAAFAQNEPQLITPMTVKTRIGIKAGVNLAKYDVDQAPSGQNSYTVSNKTSMNGGLLLNVPLGTMFRLQPELLYSGQGSKTNFKPATTSSTLAVEQDLGYINLPVMLQLQTTKGFYLELGPQIGYLIRAKNDGPSPYTNDIKDQLDKFDFAVCGGLGYLSRIGLGVGGRYNFGLANIIDDNNTSAGGAKLRNRVVQIDLFYLIGAGK